MISRSIKPSMLVGVTHLIRPTLSSCSRRSDRFYVTSEDESSSSDITARCDTLDARWNSYISLQSNNMTTITSQLDKLISSQNTLHGDFQALKKEFKTIEKDIKQIDRMVFRGVGFIVGAVALLGFVVKAWK
eukprot:TRINITY_DN5048_c2_g1_i1.p2 TRINITY_DN5048_c2_g1~~TRINITY_DN5048_c2_g1_i1.p2  ORF type:complete len:132 (+),score=18.99 TRINITY_DN5048_c2_g1_i1:85-480(+)